MKDFLHRYKSLLTGALTLAIFVCAVVVLRDMLAHLRWSDVTDELQRITAKKVFWASVCALLSFVALGFHDGLALKIIGRKLSPVRTAKTSFIAYAIGHSVGLSSLAAGSVRLRMYTAYGLTAAEIGTVIGLCSMTFAMGVSFLIGLTLLLKAKIAYTVLHIPHDLAQSLGLLIVIGVGMFLGFTAGRRTPVTLRGAPLNLPPLHLGLSQLLVSCGELVFAGATLYLLLPTGLQAKISFTNFLGFYVMALAAGVVSNVPGGLGVFEGLMLLMFPNVPKDKLLGAVLLYRLIYYVMPFLLCLPLFLYFEWQARIRNKYERELEQSQAPPPDPSKIVNLRTHKQQTR